METLHATEPAETPAIGVPCTAASDGRSHGDAELPAGYADIRPGIADHDGGGDGPAGFRHRLAQDDRVRLGDAEGISAADRGESGRQFEPVQQPARQPFQLVGADRQSIAPPGQVVERRFQSLEGTGFVRDVVRVIGDEILGELRHFFRRDLPVLDFEAAFQHTVNEVELDMNAARPIMVKETLPALNDMLDALDALVAVKSAQANATIASIKVQQAQSRRDVLELSGLAVVVALLCAVMITRSITRPLAQTVALARETGLGDRLQPPATATASIWTRGALRPMPKGHVMGVPGTATALAGVLSDEGLARIERDADLPRTEVGDDVAVGEYVAARLGREVVDRLVG